MESCDSPLTSDPAARTLRNVLHFLVNIGDVCNAKLGSPYRKCRQVFAEARADCSQLLGDFNFLCDIVDGFLPLCSIARGAFTDIVASLSCQKTLKELCTDLTVLMKLLVSRGPCFHLCY